MEWLNALASSNHRCLQISRPRKKWKRIAAYPSTAWMYLESWSDWALTPTPMAVSVGTRKPRLFSIFEVAFSYEAALIGNIIPTANDVQGAAFKKGHDVDLAGFGSGQRFGPVLSQNLGVSIVNVRIGAQYFEVEGGSQEATSLFPCFSWINPSSRNPSSVSRPLPLLRRCYSPLAMRMPFPSQGPK